MARFGGLLLSAVLVLAGCSNSGESAGQEPTNELEATSAAPSESSGTEVAEAEAKAPAPIKVRTSPEGRWLVVITDIPEATNFPAILLEISKAGDKYEAKLLEAQHLPG